MALVVAVGVLLALVLWLGWRKPIWLFLFALGSLAIRPQLLWGGPTVGYEWEVHHTLIVCALVVSALHYGVRRTVNWPILALLATFVLSLAFGNLHPKLTLPTMLMSLALLALPFAFTQLVLTPGSRRLCGLTIASAAILSVALGGALQTVDITTVFKADEWVGDYRLRGALGEAEPLGILAFAGFAVALHETTRPGRFYASYLAATNAAIVILTGTRMAMAASVIFAFAYMLNSEDVRAALVQNRRALIVAMGTVAAALLFYGPWLEARFVKISDGTFQMSGRDVIWSVYYQEFLQSPYFGRGFGEIYLVTDAFPWSRKTPHNEYLHLLVAGGLIGFVGFAAAVSLWYRRLLQVVSPNDRVFLLAVAPALLVFATTQDVLTYWTALPIYAYFVVLLTKPTSDHLQQYELEQQPLRLESQAERQQQPAHGR